MGKAYFNVCFAVAVIALTVALSLTTRQVGAQGASGSSLNRTQPIQDDDQSSQNRASETTFVGRIVKSGNQLVLRDADNETTYQLDDQQKARRFLNRAVRVSGDLDPSSGTIHIGVIIPA